MQWWGGEDLNPRRRTPADLQSAPFGHLGTSPNLPACDGNLLAKAVATTGAGGRNRTPDPLLTRQLLYPCATPARTKFQSSTGYSHVKRFDAADGRPRRRGPHRLPRH